MKSDLWSEYDKVQERLRAARERTAQAQAEERIVEAEAESARAAIEQAVAEAASRKRVVKATKATPSIPSMASLSQADPDEGRGGTKEEAQLSSPPPPPPAGVRPTVWEVILAIPRDGELRGSDLREKLGLSEGAVNTRLSNAKHAKMIETAGWGMYRLTEQGKRLRGQHLRVVNDE